MADALRLHSPELETAKVKEALGHAVRAALAEDQEGGWLKQSVLLIGDKAAARIRQELQELDVLDVLAQGWAKVRELRAYADPIKHPPGRTEFVRLGKHKLSYDLHPVVTVAIGPLTSKPIEFTYTLTADVQAVELAINSGHVTAFGFGFCEVTGVLKRGAHELTSEHRIRKIEVPGDYPLTPPGYRIPFGPALELEAA